MKHPQLLWLGAAISGAFILLHFVAAKSRRQLLSLILRVITTLALTAALLEPTLITRTEISSSQVLFDVSNSISSQGRDAFTEELGRLPEQIPATTFSVFSFAGTLSTTPLQLNANTAAAEIRRYFNDAAAVQPAQTNLENALKKALNAQLSSSVFLLSDGLETEGSVRAAAAEYQAKGIKVYPLIPEPTLFLQQKLGISSLYAPLTVNAGDLVEVRTAVRNDFDEERTATLEIWSEEKKLYQNNVTIPAREEKLVTFKAPPLEGGLRRLRAVLRQSDDYKNKDTKNTDEQYRWISVKERSKIMLLSGTSDDERLLRQLLTAKGYALQNIVADGVEVPTKFENISEVILNNVARKQLPAEFLPQLKAYVSNGGGLIMVGGDRSFGLGGYIDTPLEEISPVRFVPPRTTKRRINSAVLLVIDKSKSMREEGKLEAAKRAAIVAIDALKDDDYVGVIGFDEGPFEVIPLKLVSINRADAPNRIRHLFADGRTKLRDTLSLARKRLSDVDAGRKHIILLTDGETADGSDGYAGEMQDLRAAGVTLTSVALGYEADAPSLKELARKGKGAFHHVLDPSQLPEIFFEDIKIATGEKTMKESGDYPVEVGPAGVRSVDIRNYPILHGFVETIAKDKSISELITFSQAKSFPILSSWNFGKGTSVAFTSDANGRWSDRWVSWDDFSSFWTQLVEHVKPKGNAKEGDVDFDLRYQLVGGSLGVDLALFDEKLATQAAPPVTVQLTEPGGEVRKTAFRPITRGRFALELAKPRQGDYRLDIRYGDTLLPPAAFTLRADSFGEAPGGGINVSLLSELAAITGGTVNPNLAELPRNSRDERHEKPLVLPFLILGFVILLSEILLRERVLSHIWHQSIGAKSRATSTAPRKNRFRSSYSRGAKTRDSAKSASNT
mgnify:CR=1 FL=1